MNKDPKNEEVVIAGHSSIEVQEIHSEINDQTNIVDDQGKVDVEKEEVCDNTEYNLKPGALQQISDENVQVSASMDSFAMSSMVESELPSAMCPMEQSTSSLPRLARAPAADECQSPMETGCDEINQAWFTTKEDKDSLQGKGVKWRQGMWSKLESETLQNNIMQYCKSRGISDPHEVVFKQSKEERKTFYRTIAKGIHRPLFAIYRRVLRMYETGNYNGKYTPEEVAKLKELRKTHGNDWIAIGLALGRSASSVKDRCRLLNEKCSSGKWSQDEENRLSQAVHDLTSTAPGESVATGILWTDVAKRVGTRSEKQCRSKWLNYLNWKECGGKEWNKTDEIELIKKIYNLGVQNESDIDWSVLANGWASARSPQWLRSKWWTIKKHVAPNLSFPETIADLHSHYAKSLKHRLNRGDTRYLHLPTTEQPLALNTTGAPLSPLTTCATVSTSVGHAITVDGEIYIARGDGKESDGVNTYEMVHLRPLPSTDPSQPTSYIIEPVHCTNSGSATSYILSQTPQEQGAKSVKAFTSSSALGQVTESDDVHTSQQNNTQESNINATQPAVVSTLPTNGGAVVLDTESLTKHVYNRAEVISRPDTRHLADEETETYVEEGATDILQQDQQLECVSEEEISTSVDEEVEDARELQNTAEQNDGSHEQSHDALAYHDRSPGETPSPNATQSLGMSFSTTDNSVYSHSVVPSLVSDSRPARIITNEVIIPQSTLPEHILQTHGDEHGFLVASSPLEIIHGTLAEVTVPTSASGISSENLIMENEMTYFK